MDARDESIEKEKGITSGNHWKICLNYTKRFSYCLGRNPFSIFSKKNFNSVAMWKWLSVGTLVGQSVRTNRKRKIPSGSLHLPNSLVVVPWLIDVEEEAALSAPCTVVATLLPSWKFSPESTITDVDYRCCFALGMRCNSICRLTSMAVASRKKRAKLEWSFWIIRGILFWAYKWESQKDG